MQAGIGKLYTLSGNKFVGYVNYKAFHHSAATNWWGELTFMEYTRIDEGGLFTIEFEDKRKSQCHLKKRVNVAVSGIPPQWKYYVTGISPIE